MYLSETNRAIWRDVLREASGCGYNTKSVKAPWDSLWTLYEYTWEGEVIAYSIRHIVTLEERWYVVR